MKMGCIVPRMGMNVIVGDGWLKETEMQKDRVN
jgi:hypothetical protein